MNWKEIKMVVNSDLTKSLDNLFNELNEEDIKFLNNIIDKLDNTAYGLEAIKNSLGSSGSSGSSNNKNLFYTTGFKKTLIKDINSVSTLPYSFWCGSAVVYNGEIHILGGSSGTTAKYHYKWDGASWTSVSTLPYAFCSGSAVVYNNEIHILGGEWSNIGPKYHYKWDGTSWTSVSTLPYYFTDGGSVIIYNNEIHILGSGYSSSYYTKHYKWDGSSWTSVSTLPYNFYCGSAVVFNNEIHILGGNGGSTAHYKWDGTSWTSVSTLPYSFTRGSAVVYNNEIHIMGGSGNSTAHYKWDGSSWWVKGVTLPYDFYDYSKQGSAVVYNDEIHILGSYSTSYQKCHYNLNIEYLISNNYIPSGTNIYFYNDYFLSSAITAKTNCSIQSDGSFLSFLVDSDGLVEFITNNIYYMENDIINFTANF